MSILLKIRIVIEKTMAALLEIERMNNGNLPKTQQGHGPYSQIVFASGISVNTLYFLFSNIVLSGLQSSLNIYYRF